VHVQEALHLAAMKKARADADKELLVASVQAKRTQEQSMVICALPLTNG